MVTILISFFMFALVVVAGLMTVIILMQKPSANAGMGAALGGGAAESVFGGEAAGQLLKFTVRVAVAFFLLSFLLYLGIVAANRPSTAESSLPVIAVPVSSATTPTTPTTAGITTKTTVPAGTGAAAATPASSATKPASTAASGSAK